MAAMSGEQIKGDALTKSVLSVEALGYQYSDGHVALENITFTINEGERVGIIGDNGAGKSTLLLILCGLLHGTEGSVKCMGMESNHKNFKTIAQALGVVFQNADDQLFSSTVYEDIAFGLIQAGKDKKIIDSMVQAAMEKVSVTHLKDRAPQKLSGGEKRAVAIATAIVHEPELLILDEPTTGLAPKAKRGLVSLLKGFSHTQIITSHDLEFIKETCDRVIFLNRGQLIADEPANLLLSDEKRLIEGGL